MKKIIIFFCILLFLSCSLNWAKGSAPAYPHSQFSKNLLPFELPNKQWVYINRNGKIVIKLDPKFGDASQFSDGRAIVWQQWKLSVIDENGQILKTTPFYNIHPFSDGLAAFTTKENGKWGFMDTKGRVVIEPQFEDYPNSFSEGLAKVNKAGQWSFIDKTGKVVIQNNSHARPFSEGLAAQVKDNCNFYKQEKCYGFIDRSGRFVIEPQFTWAGSFSERLAAIQINGALGYIDKENKMVIKPQFQGGSDFHEGLAAVACVGSRSQCKFGYINQKGQIVIAGQFDDALPFSEGLAAVMVNRKWGFINTKGEMVIPPQYDYADYFWGGITKVTKRQEDGEKIVSETWIDKEGKPIVVK